MGRGGVLEGARGGTGARGGGGGKGGEGVIREEGNGGGSRDLHWVHVGSTSGLYQVFVESRSRRRR